MRPLVTLTFARAVKTLHPAPRPTSTLPCGAPRMIPASARRRSAAWFGVQVYKFRTANQLCLVAYRVLDQETVKLLMVGPHESFYRDLKRAED